MRRRTPLPTRPSHPRDRAPPPCSSVHNYTGPMHKDATAAQAGEPRARRPHRASGPLDRGPRPVEPKLAGDDGGDDAADELEPEERGVLAERDERWRVERPRRLGVDDHEVVLRKRDAQDARGSLPE